MTETKRRMGIVSFSVDGRNFRFKTPLMLDNEYNRDKKQLCLSNKELKLSAVGRSWTDTSDGIREELAALWRDYALAPDEELPEGVIALKQKLLSMVVEE